MPIQPDTLTVGYGKHPEEEDLERFAMLAGTEQENAAIETHLTHCRLCRARLGTAKAWVTVIRIGFSVAAESGSGPKTIARLTGH